VQVRATTPDDLPALHALFLEAIAGVYRLHAFEPPAPPVEVFAAQQGHILRHDGARCLVAEDGGEPLGFVSAWARGAHWFLASLFVASAAQGRGVGNQLLDRAWGEGYARRRTITDAIQPVSNALYARRGLFPATPVLTFRGVPVRAAAGLEPGAGPVEAIDAAAYGFDRGVDHEYWETIARRTVWYRHGEPVAYSYAFPGGAVGPVAGLDPAAAAAALAGELRRAEGAAMVRIPGSANALVEVALEAGLALEPVPGLLLLSRGAAPPDALAIAGYTLF
jgi:putative acetyltransferase